MFSDTHCHVAAVHGRGESIPALIREMAERSYAFVLDIGTRAGDFSERLSLVAESASGGSCPPFIHFSCGIWPDGAAIADRYAALASLEADVVAMLAFSRHRLGQGEGDARGAAHVASVAHVACAALGECGLDRYWNGPAATARAASGATDDGPGTEDTVGEEELFCAQLELAKKYSLPVIVHSREAFDATLGCIRESGRDDGVIHCFSYGRDEARAFLDRGWHISFPGTVTWPKRQADRDRVAELVRYVPRDRMLLETDAPYLAPVPFRGKTNTPLLIERTYECVAGMLDMDVAALALLVAENARRLFALRG